MEFNLLTRLSDLFSNSFKLPTVWGAKPPTAITTKTPPDQEQVVVDFPVAPWGKYVPGYRKPLLFEDPWQTCKIISSPPLDFEKQMKEVRDPAQHPIGLQSFGDILFQQGSFKEAVEVYQRGIQEAFTEEILYAYYDEEDESEDEVESVYHRGPQYASPEHYRQLGLATYCNRNYIEAQAAFEKIPPDEFSLSHLGLIHFAQDFPNRAVNYFTGALVASELGIDFHRNNFDNSQQIFEAKVKKEGYKAYGSDLILYALGHAAHKSQNYPLAASAFKALVQYYDHRDPLHNVQQVLAPENRRYVEGIESNEFGEMVKDLDQIHRYALDPQSTSQEKAQIAYLNLKEKSAKLKIKNSDLKRSQEIFLQSDFLGTLRIHARFPEALYLLGLAYRDNNQAAEALQILYLAKGVDPQLKKATTAREELIRGFSRRK